MSIIIHEICGTYNHVLNMYKCDIYIKYNKTLDHKIKSHSFCFSPSISNFYLECLIRCFPNSVYN